MSTTIADALDYGVNWGANFGGGNAARSETFVSNTNPLATIVNSGGFTSGGYTNNIGGSGILNTPDATITSLLDGFDLGIIGRKLSHCGTEFASIGALVKAVHNKDNSNIVMNPKILTEDNVPAEIFVGPQHPLPNTGHRQRLGNIVTNNYEYRDIGTTLKVTPLLSNTDIVTLEIKQEVSRVLPNTNTGAGGFSQHPRRPERRVRTRPPPVCTCRINSSWSSAA